MTETEWVVRDESPRSGAQRELKFTGVKLADVSSHQAGKDRWTEFRLFRTLAGNYVLERIGRTTVRGEVDRFFAVVCETASGVIETVYQKDDDKVWYLSWIARDMLDEAGKKDEEILRAYAATEHVA